MHIINRKMKKAGKLITWEKSHQSAYYLVLAKYSVSLHLKDNYSVTEVIVIISPPFFNNKFPEDKYNYTAVLKQFKKPQSHPSVKQCTTNVTMPNASYRIKSSS